jgi:hypothetical protein
MYNMNDEVLSYSVSHDTVYSREAANNHFLSSLYLERARCEMVLCVLSMDYFKIQGIKNLNTLCIILCFFVLCGLSFFVWYSMLNVTNKIITTYNLSVHCTVFVQYNVHFTSLPA